jgi:predicted PurR-regulated permease PerM
MYTYMYMYIVYVFSSVLRTWTYCHFFPLWNQNTQHSTKKLINFMKEGKLENLENNAWTKHWREQTTNSTHMHLELWNWTRSVAVIYSQRTNSFTNYTVNCFFMQTHVSWLLPNFWKETGVGDKPEEATEIQAIRPNRTFTM